jgi:hypothetical protein
VLVIKSRGREGDILLSCHIVTCDSGWGLVILKKVEGGRGTYNCHPLWWCWMGLVIKKGKGGGHNIVILIACHYLWCGLVINKLGRGYVRHHHCGVSLPMVVVLGRD